MYVNIHILKFAGEYHTSGGLMIFGRLSGASPTLPSWTNLLDSSFQILFFVLLLCFLRGTLQNP